MCLPGMRDTGLIVGNGTRELFLRAKATRDLLFLLPLPFRVPHPPAFTGMRAVITKERSECGVPNETRLAPEQTLARCEKVALVGVQARDLQFAFRWPRQRFDPNFSIQTWATGLVERGNIR